MRPAGKTWTKRRQKYIYLKEQNGQLNNSNSFLAGSGLQGASQFYGVATPQVDDLQAEFRAIQDSYSRVRIPGDLKFNGNKVGLKAQHKESANVISTCSRYTETCLKILTHVQDRVGDPAYMVNLQLQELYTCLYAMLRYLQEDHCALVVASNFGPRTQTLFRNIQKNTSAFTPELIFGCENCCDTCIDPTGDPAGTAILGEDQEATLAGEVDQ